MRHTFMVKCLILLGVLLVVHQSNGGNPCRTNKGKCKRQKKCKGIVNTGITCSNNKKVCCTQESLPERCILADGFLNPVQDRCYVFKQDRLPWLDAFALCYSKGVQKMAEPRDTDAKWLRKHIIDIYGGDKETWMGGRGDGTDVRFVLRDEIISSSNSLWYPGWPGAYVTTIDCLVLATHTVHLNQYPDQPYYTWQYNYHHRVLCELI